MPSTRSIRERDEPLPSLLAQWRTPAASRATATRSASYNLALSSSASPQVARATTHALPRPTTSAHTTRRPPAAASSSSPAATATTTTNSGTDSDSSASSLEGLAKRLSTARQAKSDSHRRGSTATAAAAPPGRRRRQDANADANDDDEWEEPEDENNDGFQEDEETATALKRSTEAMAADLDDDRWSAFRTSRNRQSGASSPAQSSTRSQLSGPNSVPPQAPVDRAPADFDTGPTSVPSGAHTALDDSARGDDGEEGEHTSNDEDDEDDDDREGEADTSAAYVVSHAEGHPDPRDLLRAQLARPAPSRSTSRPSLRTARTDSLSLGQAASSRPTRRVEEADATLVANDSEEALLYLPRRYFILSTAGKLVYTSCVSSHVVSQRVGPVSFAVRCLRTDSHTGPFLVVQRPERRSGDGLGRRHASDRVHLCRRRRQDPVRFLSSRLVERLLPDRLADTLERRGYTGILTRARPGSRSCSRRRCTSLLSAREVNPNPL